jgi:hypothetical protein
MVRMMMARTLKTGKTMMWIRKVANTVLTNEHFEQRKLLEQSLPKGPWLSNGKRNPRHIQCIYTGVFYVIDISQGCGKTSLCNDING